MSDRWRFAWAWTIGATLLLAGCSAISKAVPPASPPTAAPSPSPAPQPQCSVGQTFACWNQPPGYPWLYACPIYDAAGKVAGVENRTGPDQCPAPAGPAPAPTPAPSPVGPPPAPPAGDSCPVAPCPLREWTAATLPDGWDRALIGKPAWKWNVHSYPPALIDSTPVTLRQLTFCQAIGYNDGRDSCPVRMDGDPNRVLLEYWLAYGGPRIEGRYPETPASCAAPNGNPMQFRALGNCRICSAHEEVCSDWQ
jgi:hypothetical protein